MNFTNSKVKNKAWADEYPHILLRILNCVSLPLISFCKKSSRPEFSLASSTCCFLRSIFSWSKSISLKIFGAIFGANRAKSAYWLVKAASKKYCLMFRLTSRNFLSADRLHELRHNRSVLVCISNLTTHNLGYRASALVKTHPGNCCVGWVKQPNISDVLVRSELFD